MLTVPLIARFLYETQCDLPLKPIPWERPQGVSGSDDGGPLPGQKPPPPLGEPKGAAVPGKIPKPG